MNGPKSMRRYPQIWVWSALVVGALALAIGVALAVGTSAPPVTPTLYLASAASPRAPVPQAALSPPAPEIPTQTEAPVPYYAPSASPPDTPARTGMPEPAAAALHSSVVVAPAFSITHTVYLSVTSASPLDVPEHEPYAVEGQIIVTGPTLTVTSMIRSYALTPTESFRLVYSGSGNSSSSSLAFAGANDVTMSLCQVEHDRLATVVTAITSDSETSGVSAEPNYLVALSEGACSNPYEPAISPYEPAISSEILNAETAGSFWDQWALSSIVSGSVPISDARGTGLLTATGEGALVLVFDTSPFTEDVTAGTESFAVSITAITPTLHLSVSHPARPTLPPPSTTMTMPAGISNHGLFVAGLAHAVAPDSEIWLVRTFDEHGRTDLWTLGRHLVEFVGAAVGSGPGGDGPPAGIVVNLSAGLCASWCTETGSLRSIALLRAALLPAHVAGVTVVAAAGNDSDASQPLSPHYPAAFSPVLGVGASNGQDGRARFSNEGDAYAPGGDGVENCEPKDPARECCKHLLSLVREPVGTYGYGCWSGTSFSTPLASGLAALVLDANAAQRGNPWAQPEQVRGSILCGSVPPLPGLLNVIDVLDTLDNCVP